MQARRDSTRYRPGPGSLFHPETLVGQGEAHRQHTLLLKQYEILLAQRLLERQSDANRTRCADSA